MEMGTKVANRSVAAMLVLSRLFLLLMYSPEKDPQLRSSGYLLMILVGYGLVVLSLVPAWLLLRQRPEQGLAEAAGLLWPASRKVVALSFGLLCLAAVVETAVQFEFFMTSAVYPDVSHWMVLAIFLLAAGYLGWLGLEALSRLAVVVLVLTVLSFAVVFAGVNQEIDLLNLYSPLYYGWGPVLRSAVRFWGLHVEAAAFLLLIPRLQSPRPWKTFLWYTGISLAVLEGILFVVNGVLGSFGRTRTFPIYTVFSLSGSSIFYRMDYIHIVSWVAISLVRAVLYLILGAQMLGQLLPLSARPAALWLLLGAAGGFCLLLLGGMPDQGLAVLFFLSGALELGLVVVLPTVLLGRLWFGKSPAAVKGGCGHARD